MKKFMKAFGFMVLVAVSYLLASVMSGVVIGGYLGIKNAALMDAQGMDAFNDAMMAGMADLMLPMLIMINVITLVLVMLYFLGRKDNFIKYVQFKKFKVMDGIYLAILGIFMNLFLIACLQYASRLLPIDNQMEQYAELMEGILNGNFIMILMALTISAPLFEEIVIRGIVFNDF